MRPILTLLSFLIAFVFGAAQDNFTQASIQGMFDRNHDQIISLAEAFTEDQYDWRPEEGVRSVGEALLHVAQANYFFMMKLGQDLPEGVDMMTLPSMKGKDNIVSAVTESFSFASEKITSVPSDSFEEMIEMPFGEFSTLSVMLILLEHSGEHKGQLIAYARSNGIVPPWSEQ